MKRSSLMILALILFIGCGPQPMTSERAAAEKKAVEAQIVKFLDAYAAKDWEPIKSVVSTSSEFLLFGTDSAEVIKSAADFETQIKTDWQLFESPKHGELRNLSIQIANGGDLASAVYEVPFDAAIGGQNMHLLFRFATTWKKENNEWRMIQGALAAATVGQSSKEMVEKMKSSNQ
jgi:ketosteroid isomerase-like protein